MTKFSFNSMYLFKLLKDCASKFADATKVAMAEAFAAIGAAAAAIAAAAAAGRTPAARRRRRRWRRRPKRPRRPARSGEDFPVSHDS